ncbi:P-loop containing nucleoside triphosphate hydrolase [Glarea lozoyensis ATCC 20868]|uniref:ATP-dependent DNA helicase n=1 Tax=Glarea lozoyensis (strain ATCC 20868 / MF5171) TaxID=1116229 RepID=S3CPA4_GLAL2|nr:P-loop containing nucleoside triphosphate hydrolase [Glarea lozoyensis ATCC 20868]EPE26994.1 P-loop containing nucleoside triphosphate hydrolase [Glarea lozoyensis ATCC 20868]
MLYLHSTRLTTTKLGNRLCTNVLMGRKRSTKAAYVVFIGRTRGVFTSWSECEAQIHGYPGNSQKGFESAAEARTAWKEFRRSTQWTPSLTPLEIPDRLPAQDLLTKNIDLFDPKEHQASSRKRNFEAMNTPSPLEPASEPARYKKSNQNATTREIAKPNKSPELKLEPSDPTYLQKGELANGEEPASVKLTSEQQAVVDMALTGANIFLTGAAGSGKTVTLREMIRRLQKRYQSKNNSDHPCVQVVAPTGIAALPLDGKTTFSFAGWNPDSLQQPMERLLANVRKSTREAVDRLRVLIIEEISMVENQFLERLNRLLQSILMSNAPFGGIQVILVGDFHQLPPVKPFENCIECGEMMVHDKVIAPVWDKLKLRFVKLEQIHRQKDTGFQGVLNKIRNGQVLENSEWDELERTKELPPQAVATRLMSLVNDVTRFNNRELGRLNTQVRSWKAFDVSNKKRTEDADKFDPRCQMIAQKCQEFKDALMKYHRLPTDLNLKVGAKVVLLSNLSPKSGLVNGSQGEVVGFADTTTWTSKDDEGTYQRECADQFTTMNSFWRPVVRFANGQTKTIPHVVQSSTKISGEDRYHVARTQIPLTLAWALSIHKSQGMTLQYAEVSSRGLFETGQLYVGLSRVTSLEGLIVTGFSREKTVMDPDVIEFYEKTAWEDLSRSDVSPSTESKTEAAAPNEWWKGDYVPLFVGKAHPAQVKYPQLPPFKTEICDSDEEDSQDEQG